LYIIILICQAYFKNAKFIQFQINITLQFGLITINSINNNIMY